MYNRYITDVLKYRFIYLKSLVFLLLSSLKKRLIHFCTVSPPILSQRIELTIPCADPEQFFQPGGGGGVWSDGYLSLPGGGLGRGIFLVIL